MPTEPASHSDSAGAPVARLKKRPDFLAAAGAAKCARGAVVAQGRRRDDDDPLIRVGFTATRRIGGAVVRNRAKRRLREAATTLIPLLARQGCDYVFVARGGTASRPWDSLLGDMRQALARLSVDLASDLDRPPPTSPIAGPDKQT